MPPHPHMPVFSQSLHVCLLATDPSTAGLAWSCSWWGWISFTRKRDRSQLNRMWYQEKYAKMSPHPQIFKLTTLGHVSFCPTPQCDKAKPDTPGSPSQQSSRLKNKDKIQWQLLNINRAYQQGWAANSGSHPQVLKAVPKSPNSSRRAPLKNSTKKMSLYFRNKLLRWWEIKAEEETRNHHRTILHSSSPLGAHHDAKHIIDAQ